jgi:hypothetical protein
MKTKNPVCPIINLNGSNPQSLLDSYIEAMNALETAADLMSKIDVHGRDYQLNPPGEYNRAMIEHQSRLNNLALMHDELEFIGMNISDQITQRRAHRPGR